MAGLEKNGSGAGVKYIPTIQITIPQRETIHLSGMVEYLEKKKLAAELNLRGALKDPLRMGGKHTSVIFFV